MSRGICPHCSMLECGEGGVDWFCDTPCQNCHNVYCELYKPPQHLPQWFNLMRKYDVTLELHLEFEGVTPNDASEKAVELVKTLKEYVHCKVRDSKWKG